MIIDSPFFDDVKALGLLEDEDEATIEQREETQNRMPDSDTDSFNQPVEDPGCSEEPEGISETEIRYSLSDYRTQAEGYVDLLDLGNTMVLPAMYKRKLISPEERSRLEMIRRTTDSGQFATLSYEDQQLDKRMAEIEDLIAAIPFSSDEKTKLSDALARVLQHNQMTANPTTVLVLTLITVEGARLLPFMMMKR